MLCHMRDTTPTMFARSVSNRSAFTGAMIAAFGLTVLTGVLCNWLLASLLVSGARHPRT